MRELNSAYREIKQQKDRIYILENTVSQLSLEKNTQDDSRMLDQEIRMSRREMKKRMRASVQRKGQARSHSRENRNT